MRQLREKKKNQKYNAKAGEDVEMAETGNANTTNNTTQMTDSIKARLYAQDE